MRTWVLCGWLLSAMTAAAWSAVDAGNLTCPVGGDKINGKDYAEIDGTRYGVCCAMCIAKLQKNPAKYLQ